MQGAGKFLIWIACCIGLAAPVLARELGKDSAAFQAKVHSNMGHSYYVRGNYQLALRHMLTALDLCKASGEKAAIARSLNDIGQIYWSKQDYSNAVNYYRESLQLQQQLQDSTGTLKTLLSIAQSYHTNRQFDSTLYYAAIAEPLAAVLKQPDQRCLALAWMGKAQLALKEPETGKALLNEALQMAAGLKDDEALAFIYDGLGDSYYEQKKYADAIVQYKIGLAITNAIRDLEQKAVYYRKLQRTYRAMGSLKLAFDYNDSARNLSHRLLNEETIRQMNEMSAVYEATEREKKIAQLNAQNSIAQAAAVRRKRERNYFIVSSVLFMALALVTYRAFTSNRKKKLEKEILLKEIHHRVKNNLQMVSSLLSLQTDYIKDEQALDAVKESRNRVHSMALIHQNLYEEDHLTSVPIREYISKLCDNLFNSYTTRAVQLEKDIEPFLLDVELVVPLGLILNELVTNCLKYAFADKRNGVIRITLKKAADQLLLSVQDNGVGLPPGFSPDTTATFGFKMIKAFVQKLKANLTVYNKEGAYVELRFKP